MTAYALLADLAMVLPAAAIASVPSATQQALLDARNAYADDKMRARYRLPLASWPVSITRAICEMAAFDILCFRGYNPGSAADQLVQYKFEQAMKYFDDVERQRAHPLVTEAAPPGSLEFDAPLVVSNPRLGWDPNTAGDDPSQTLPSWSRPARTY